MSITYIGRKCQECGFVSTEEDPAYQEEEIEVETGFSRTVICCPKCGDGEYERV